MSDVDLGHAANVDLPDTLEADRVMSTLAAQALYAAEWNSNAIVEASRSDVAAMQLACANRYLLKDLHELGALAMKRGDIAVPYFELIHIPPAPMPPDMEGGGGK